MRQLAIFIKDTTSGSLSRLLSMSMLCIFLIEPGQRAVVGVLCEKGELTVDVCRRLQDLARDVANAIGKKPAAEPSVITSLVPAYTRPVRRKRAQSAKKRVLRVMMKLHAALADACQLRARVKDSNTGEAVEPPHLHPLLYGQTTGKADVLCTDCEARELLLPSARAACSALMNAKAAKRMTEPTEQAKEAYHAVMRGILTHLPPLGLRGLKAMVAGNQRSLELTLRRTICEERLPMGEPSWPLAKAPHGHASVAEDGTSSAAAAAAAVAAAAAAAATADIAAAASTGSSACHVHDSFPPLTFTEADRRNILPSYAHAVLAEHALCQLLAASSRGGPSVLSPLTDGDLIEHGRQLQAKLAAELDGAAEESKVCAMDVEDDRAGGAAAAAVEMGEEDAEGAGRGESSPHCGYCRHPLARLATSPALVFCATRAYAIQLHVTRCDQCWMVKHALPGAWQLPFIATSGSARLQFISQEILWRWKQEAALEKGSGSFSTRQRQQQLAYRRDWLLRGGSSREHDGGWIPFISSHALSITAGLFAAALADKLLRAGSAEEGDHHEASVDAADDAATAYAAAAAAADAAADAAAVAAADDAAVERGDVMLHAGGGKQW
eukprot:PLAT6332.1.p1 GENE.PLAT6332.1~~PLAT6332.1.p1  ORF type:complete len:697 (+),score=209.07 PLAT6332.1:260-2092(+)